jgi:hypothetical protein
LSFEELEALVKALVSQKVLKEHQGLDAKETQLLNIAMVKHRAAIDLRDRKAAADLRTAKRRAEITAELLGAEEQLRQSNYAISLLKMQLAAAERAEMNDRARVIELKAQLNQCQ